jgi:hypothetical protein
MHPRLCEEGGRNRRAALASLVLSIALINVWNLLNVTTRQVAGQWRPD